MSRLFFALPLVLLPLALPLASRAHAQSGRGPRLIPLCVARCKECRVTHQ